MRRFFRALIALFLAAAICVPSIHFFYRPSAEKIRDGLAQRYLSLWSARGELDEAIAGMRRTNAEWDFMSRTYLVLAFANMALEAPEGRRAEYLAAIDSIIDETLAVEQQRGMYFFLMAYARSAPFLVQPARSIFIDGELAAMLGARRLVADDPGYAELHRARAKLISERMASSDTFSAESYPDEAWTFCNSIALVSLKMLDTLDGTDHSALIAAWIEHARDRLTDPASGLLISSYHLNGELRDGPEGSSLFMVAHALQVLDENFALQQWTRAKTELIDETFGFGYAREWPSSWTGPVDVDSGPTVPILGANAGASGLAILGAAAFDDDEVLDSLLRSLELAAFPKTTAAGRRYRASNAAGDAVLLYALVEGPLWKLIRAENLARNGGRRS